VADNDAGEIRMVGHQAVAQCHELAPFREVDLGAGHVLEIDGDDLGNLVDHREAGDDLAGMHAVVVNAVVLQLERMDAQRGDGAAGADEGDLGPVCAAHGILLEDGPCRRCSNSCATTCSKSIAQTLSR
jgi:hypothetical protein